MERRRNKHESGRRLDFQCQRCIQEEGSNSRQSRMGYPKRHFAHEGGRATTYVMLPVSSIRRTDDFQECQTGFHLPYSRIDMDRLIDAKHNRGVRHSKV